MDADGDRLVCTVEIGLNVVDFQVWRANVGRVPLFLLDTNLPENEQHFRDLTNRVYGGDSTTRIMQEMLLGVGGVRLLRTLGIEPSTFHMNEGHAAFLTLELIREKMAAGKSFAEAQAQTRPECIFTTHTPVEAGHDRFSPELMNYAMQRFLTQLKVPFNDLLGLGRVKTGGQERAVLHDRAGPETFPRGQCRQRVARRRQPPHVAGALSRQNRRPKCPSAISPTAFI